MAQVGNFISSSYLPDFVNLGWDVVVAELLKAEVKEGGRVVPNRN
jgi:hypothetical protein